MDMKKAIALFLCTAMLVTVLAGCGSSTPEKSSAGKKALKNYKQNNAKLAFPTDQWNYDEANDVWYQLGVTYVANPKSKNQTLGLYVPGKYLKGKKTGDTYTCKPTRAGKKAAIVCPVNTPGYSAQAAPTTYSYSKIEKYMQAGLIYLEAGMRGRDTGAPWGVTDLKSAIRYYRFNKANLPGNSSQVYTFGHSGGGAQSSLMGATGDSPLYYQYLESTGAAMVDAKGRYISDSIAGAMCWCPITSLDEADEAYEWNMGQLSGTGVRKAGTETANLSEGLARQYPKFINKLKLRDEKGKKLKLEKSDEGIYLSGSYYDYLVKVVQTSLNNFLKDTTFPYTKTENFMAGMGRKGAAGGIGGAGSQASSVTAKTYETVEDYFTELNKNGTWVKYNKEKNTATVLNLEGFIKTCKSATKGIGAFDDVGKVQAENQLFGNGDTRHFDAILADLTKGTQYENAYAEDMEKTDSLGTDLQTRMNMYNPMFYLNKYYDGYGTSRVAPHWRIRTGIEQGDTALCTEVNLALALEQLKEVKDVDFATIWGLGHTMAEETGDAETNFIQWVRTCVK